MDDDLSFGAADYVDFLVGLSLDNECSFGAKHSPRDKDDEPRLDKERSF